MPLSPVTPRSFHALGLRVLLGCSLFAASGLVSAQSLRLDLAPSVPAAGEAAAVAGSETLPDAPSEVAAASSSSSSIAALDPSSPFAQDVQTARAAQKNPPGTPGSPLPRTASPTDLVIAAGQTAPHQTAGNKIVSSLKDSVSPYGIAGNTISAGWSHLINSSPHYGTDGDAFAQRFGASMARGTSQSIFSNGALAAILHEDTRYYQLGPGHPIVSRAWSAVRQPFIARTDGGRRTPNFALLGGYLGAAALTPTYYPPRDQSFGDVLSTWGTGIAGSMIGFGVDEFLPQILQAVHLQKLNRTGY